LFFAGQNHVHIQIIASPTEQSLITTNPGQVQAIEQQQQQRDSAQFQQPQAGYADPNQQF